MKYAIGFNLPGYLPVHEDGFGADTVFDAWDVLVELMASYVEEVAMDADEDDKQFYRECVAQLDSVTSESVYLMKRIESVGGIDVTIGDFVFWIMEEEV